MHALAILDLAATIDPEAGTHRPEPIAIRRGLPTDIQGRA